MAKIKRVDQIRRILKTYLQTRSIMATAARLKVSKNTVREYKWRAEAYHADLSLVLALDDEALRPVLYPDKASAKADRQLVFQGKVDDYLRRLRHRHVTRQLLFEQYRRDFPDGYRQTQFYQHLACAEQRRDLSLPLSPASLHYCWTMVLIADSMAPLPMQYTLARYSGYFSR